MVLLYTQLWPGGTHLAILDNFYPSRNPGGFIDLIVNFGFARQVRTTDTTLQVSKIKLFMVFTIIIAPNVWRAYIRYYPDVYIAP